MCANFTPVTERERMLAHFRLDLSTMSFPPEAWPGYVAPFIRQSRDTGVHSAELCAGRFGLVPHWAKDPTIGRRTYNARSETAAEKPSFRDAWRFGRRCIVPAENFYEPNWQTGKAVRWRISRSDGAPMGIAGLWSFWRAPDGVDLLSFTMLTVNADAHRVMRQFHRPDDEKRMVVILNESDYDRWLDAPQERMPGFLGMLEADALVAEPAPRDPGSSRRKTD
jgi:putative SOS response-associated peptidase YedK